MEAGAIRPGYELWRPNRQKAEAKSARALVILLLLVSAGIALVITIGGWERLEGGKIFALAYIALYILFAFLVSRWNRGVLPVASALAIILAIFAGIAAPAWFDRAKDGLDSPALPEELLGLLTLLLVPVQVILIAVAMVAFNQEWHVEEERQIGDEIDVEPTPLPSRMRTAGRRASGRRTAASSGSGTRSTGRKKTTGGRRSTSGSRSTGGARRSTGRRPKKA